MQLFIQLIHSRVPKWIYFTVLTQFGVPVRRRVASRALHQMLVCGAPEPSDCY